MDLLNEDLKNYNTHGMSYFFASVTEAVVGILYENLEGKPDNRDDFVKTLYDIYNEEKAGDAKKAANGEFDAMVGNELLEELLITAVYVDKKLTWEDIEYTKSHGRLPENIIKAGFPFDEIKEEMFKQGYVVPEKQKAEEETL